MRDRNRLWQKGSRALALILAASMAVSLGTGTTNVREVYAAEEETSAEDETNQDLEKLSEEELTTLLNESEETKGTEESTDDDKSELEDDSNPDSDKDEKKDDDSEDQNVEDDDESETKGDTETADDSEENGDAQKDENSQNDTDVVNNAGEETAEAKASTISEFEDDEEEEEQKDATSSNEKYDSDFTKAAEKALESANDNDETKATTLVYVAESQVGYEEQIADDDVDDDDAEPSYSMYGDWYSNGDNSDMDWNTAFAIWCLDQADISYDRKGDDEDSIALPVRATISAWSSAADDAGWYMTSAAGVSLAAGDIVFLDLDNNGEADHVGIVASTENDENDPTIGFNVVIGDLSMDTMADYYKVDDKDAADSVQEIYLPGDDYDLDAEDADPEAYVENIVTGYISVASYIKYLDSTENGGGDPSNDPLLIPENTSTSDFRPQVTSAKMQKLVNGYWVDATEFDDGDQIRIALEYAYPDTNNVTEGTSITYQLPDGCVPNDNLSGIVTGYINNTYYSNLGTYTISEDGLITIKFNETFHQTTGAFTGTIEFQGTASNDGETDKKQFTFYEGGQGYIINEKKVDEDLQITKTGSKKAGETVATYTVTVTSKNGTGSDPVKIVDTVWPSGLDMTQIKYENVKVVDKDGNVISVSNSQITTGSTDTTKTLTITDLPALAAGGSYTITYDIDFGATIGTGEATLNNNVHGFKGNTDKGNASAYITVAQKMIEKSANATDNNGAVLWTISINPNRLSNVAGTYNLADYFNGSSSTIDWSTVTDFKIEKLDSSTWTTSDVTDALGSQVKAGSITIENGCSYTITYKTKVTYPEGTTTVTQTNKTEITKDGESWSGEGSTTVTKPEWKVGKTGTGVKEDEGSKTATAGWTSTVTLPLQSDGTTGFGAEGLLFKDTITNNNDERDTGVHYTTPGILKDSLVVKLDGKTLDSSDYTIKYYDANSSLLTDPDDNTEITYFEVVVNGPQTGVSMTFSYNTKMVIKDLKDGKSLTVKNTSEAGGKTSSATQTYKKPSSIIKNSSGTAFSTPIVDSTGKTTLDYKEIDGKIYYRVVVYPNSEKGSTLTDQLPEGLTLDAANVTIQYTNGAYGLWKQGWYNEFYFDYDANSGLQATVEVTGDSTNGGQTLTVKLPDVSEVHDTSGNNRKMPSGTFDGVLGYVIDYWVTVSDDFWEDLNNSTKTYTNSASWNGKTTSQDTEIKRTTPTIAKVGTQELATDGSRSNTIRYYVTINPAAQTLNEGRDLTLTDSLANNAYGIELELDLTSVKLYRYDKTNTDDHYLGDQMSQNAYTFQYNNTTNTFTAGIPDATACVLVYEYTVTNWNGYANQASLINNISLEGSDKTEGSSETKIQAADSSATVKKENTLKLIKVDSQRYQKVLPGAEFELYYYDTTSQTWKQSSLQHTFTTTDPAGEINFDTTLAGSSVTTNVLYKLVETKAPSGYSLPDTYTPYYFVMLADGSTKDTFWVNIGAATDSDPSNTSETRTVIQTDVTFVDYKGAGTIYAPNRYSSIEVEKSWVDEDGEKTTPAADSVQVQLYRQKTKADCYTVTVNTNTNNGNYPNTKTYQVEKGTALNLYYKYGSNGTFSYTATDGSSGKVTGGTYYQYPNQQSALIVFNAVNQDMTVTVTGTNIAGWDGFDWNSIIVAEYTEPSSYVGDGDKTAYEDAKTLNANNSWKATWTNLPVVDADGNPYYYTVEELGDNTEWKVTYSNNGGIQTGVIGITNHTVRKYDLPKTGGAGTLPIELGGFAATLGAMFVGYSRRRRDRKEGET